MILSSEEGSFLSEMFRSFREQNDDTDDNKTEIPLRIDEFHYYNNSPNSNLFMCILTNDKPSFYVKKQILSTSDGGKNYYQSIQNEKNIFLQNYKNKIDYEQKYDSHIYDCTNIDSNCNYSPFISYAIEDENNFIKLPFYPGMSIRYLVSNKVDISDTDKQVWAYELACAFYTLHQQGICHKYFSSDDVFLTSSIDSDELYSSNVYFNIAIGNFTYDLDHEKIKSKPTEQFFYRSPEFINDPSTEIPKATLEQLKKNDVHSFGVFMNELLQFKDPKDFSSLKSRKERLEIMNKSEPCIYLNIDKNSDNKWIPLIIRCTDKNPDNRPTFDEIKDILSKEEFFLSNASHKEFLYRIKNIRTDTTCRFETLAYVNKKYPSFKIIEHILNEVKNEIVNRYSINFQENPDLSVVDQIYLILNSSSYLIRKLIEGRKMFFSEFAQNDPEKILRSYTNNQNLIDLILNLIQNKENDTKDDIDIQENKTELIQLRKKLLKLSDLYYSEKLKHSEYDILSIIHKNDLKYLIHLFARAIPISEDQINLIYQSIFNFDYIKTIDFLTHLQMLSEFNLNFFRSLQNIYTLLKNFIINSYNEDISMNQINDIYKSIYNTILNIKNTQTIFTFDDNPVYLLFEKIQSMLHFFNEGDQREFNDNLAILKNGLVLQKNTNIKALDFLDSSIESIYSAEKRRRDRLQTKKIEITGLSKSSLRAYLTRIVKSYQSSYNIELTIKLDNKGIKNPIKMCDIKAILEKLGIKDINSNLPNVLSFSINRNS
ncbi:hypothetical protein M9Y10_012679 [Tritrichomonas musculus]|uniref:Protein kinase domain-containing protein n=1 Tax=Tritrichomonas musculus TaxID=1915356 RepID=A0ABR2ID38_9EUKA